MFMCKVYMYVPGSNILLNYLEKTSEHHFIPEYTYLPIYLPIKTFSSVVYSVHGVITIQNHPGPN